MKISSFRPSLSVCVCVCVCVCVSSAATLAASQVVEQQKLLVDHWDVHYVDQQRGKAYWCNWVTEERRWTKPAEAASEA